MWLSRNLRNSGKNLRKRSRKNHASNSSKNDEKIRVTKYERTDKMIEINNGKKDAVVCTGYTVLWDTFTFFFRKKIKLFKRDLLFQSYCVCV